MKIYHIVTEKNFPITTERFIIDDGEPLTFEEFNQTLAYKGYLQGNFTLMYPTEDMENLPEGCIAVWVSKDV